MYFIILFRSGFIIKYRQKHYQDQDYFYKIHQYDLIFIMFISQIFNIASYLGLPTI